MVRCGGLQWLIVALGAAACVSAPQLRGPLATRNQHPAQLLVGHLGPTSARVLPAGEFAVRADAAYTSLFLFGATPRSTWFMDGEVLRVAGGAAYGLGHGLQVELELPFAHAGSGFLDSFLIDYHRLFGLPDQDRSSLPRDVFRVDASQDGQSVWGVEPNGIEWMDVPVRFAWQVTPPADRQVGVALRAALELPTGDPDKGYGNGEVDVALGAVAEYWRNGVGYTAHAQHAFAGTPPGSRSRGFSFEDVTAAGLALEIPLKDDLSMLLQVEWETSTLRRLGPPSAGNEQAYLWVGGRWSPSPAWSWEVAFGEDLLEQASPDFTAYVGMEWRPGAEAKRRRPAGR